MANGNVIRNVYKNNDIRRIKVYYDRKPSTSVERDKRVCMVLTSSGQTIRLDEGETLDLMMELTKALKWKQQRSGRF